MPASTARVTRLRADQFRAAVAIARHYRIIARMPLLAIFAQDECVIASFGAAMTTDGDDRRISDMT